jgi:hypothetical protein
MKITNLLVAGDYSVVEMDCSAKIKAGGDFFQDMCWICRYDDTNACVYVKIYIDTLGEKLLFES